MADVVTNVDKELTILIHSDNSQFPFESESLKRTIRRIINDAVENCI
jgi:hypothetical protein